MANKKIKGFAARATVRMYNAALSRIVTSYHKSQLGGVNGTIEIQPGAEIRTPEQIFIGNNTLIKRGAILNGRSNVRRFGLSLSNNVYIKEYSYIDAYDGFIEFLGACNVGQFCILAGQGGITVGRYVMISPHTYVLSSNHIFTNLQLPYMFQGNSIAPVSIEDNVWIGGRTIILPGVTIGRNAIVGAGSIITKDVPPNTLVVSNVSQRILRELHTNFG